MPKLGLYHDADVILLTSNTGAVTRSAAGNIHVRKDNLTGVAAPDVSDDSSADYEIGSTWLDTVGGNFYVCKDATQGAAVWLATVQAPVTPGGSDTQIQYNSLGSFAGSPNLTWSSATLGVTGNVAITNGAAGTVPLSITGSSGQTANLLNVTTYGGIAGDLFKIDANGVVTIQARSGSATASGFTIKPNAVTSPNNGLQFVAAGPWSQPAIYNTYHGPGDGGYIAFGNFISLGRAGNEFLKIAGDLAITAKYPLVITNSQTAGVALSIAGASGQTANLLNISAYGRTDGNLANLNTSGTLALAGWLTLGGDITVHGDRYRLTAAGGGGSCEISQGSAALSWLRFIGNGSTTVPAFKISTSLLEIKDCGNTVYMAVGMGNLTVNGFASVVSTTEQLRLAYDVSNYYSTTVSSAGVVTFDAVGSGAGFTFSDRVGVGVTTPLTMLHVAETTTSATRGLTVSQHNDGVQTPQLSLYKTRGTVASPTTIVANDYLGRVAFAGYTSSYVESAYIWAATAGTITATSVPSYMAFSVTAVGGTTPTERIRLYASGDVGIGTINAGVSIGALIHGIKTGEQLRLGYDASNYTSFTVGSTGSITFDAVGTYGTQAGVIFNQYVRAANGVAPTYGNYAWGFGYHSGGPHVYGGAYASGNNRYIRIAGSTNIKLYLQNAANVLFQTWDCDTGKVGINTTAPDKQVEINSATGDCLRLTYNDADGSAAMYTDFLVGSDALLTIKQPIGTWVRIQNGGNGSAGLHLYADYPTASDPYAWLKFSGSLYGDDRSYSLYTYRGYNHLILSNTHIGTTYTILDLYDGYLMVGATGQLKLYKTGQATIDCDTTPADLLLKSDGTKSIKLALDSTDYVAVTASGVALSALTTITRTDEQLRLRYDAAKYAKFVVSSAGRLDITTVSDSAGAHLYLNPNSNQIHMYGNGTNVVRCTIYDNLAGQSWGEYSGDRWNLISGLATVHSVNVTTGVVFNEMGANLDFRIEGDTNVNMFVVDASADMIGIGTAEPAAQLHILKATEQLRLGYNTSNFTSFTTNSGGDLTITPSGGNLTIATADVDIASDKAYYLGAPGTDGTWRIVRSSNNLLLERREAGIYVTKTTITA